MRLAVLADIHGNILALEAVLADLAGRGCDRVVDLGDCVSGPLWPRETMARLAALGAATVRGNHDRLVAAGDPAGMGPSDRFAAEALTAEERERLGGLPPTLAVAPGILACHARPRHDELYLLDDIRDGRLVRAAPDAIARRVAGVDAAIVLCGHSHRPDFVRVPGALTVLNPGSVGCPAYEDPVGRAHVSETGSPHARYAILDLSEDEPRVEWFALPYAWEDAARRAERNARPDWAHALRTGFMPR